MLPRGWLRVPANAVCIPAAVALLPAVATWPSTRVENVLPCGEGER